MLALSDSCHNFFFVIERTRDLIYLKFVATDFFPKIISPSAGENSGDFKGVASTFEVVRPGSRSGLLWVCQEVGVFSFCCRLHVLFYF